MERIENGMDQMEKWKKGKRKMANGEESKGNNRAAAATTKLRQKLADTKGSRAEEEKKTEEEDRSENESPGQDSQQRKIGEHLLNKRKTAR